MRDLRLLSALAFNHPRLGPPLLDGTAGAYMVPHPPTAVTLLVVASAGEGWDHVSVSLPNRCPNWFEMEHIKRMFFCEHETAMQLHVPPSDHISVHPYCLHLWRPHGVEIPRPPGWMVGPQVKGGAHA